MFCIRINTGKLCVVDVNVKTFAAMCHTEHLHCTPRLHRQKFLFVALYAESYRLRCWKELLFRM
jgi:hypothetical protein